MKIEALRQARIEAMKKHQPIRKKAITDKNILETRVREIAETAGIELLKSNQSVLMRQISANLKGIADMKIVSTIVKELLK